MKKILICLLLICILGGCSTKKKLKSVTYDWAPPLEDIRWGMGEKEVLEAVGLEESAGQWSVTNDKQEVLSFSRVMNTKVGMASPDFVFESGFGLVGVVLWYLPMEEAADETLEKLEEAYGKNSDGQWMGTKFGELGLSKEQIVTFSDVMKVSDDESIVKISLNQDPTAISYQKCIFEAKYAANLEQVLR
ncbi:hypothetical protein [Enterococcus diestrammenae]|uniref:hypothetical protein n=1 Tax=Enterococcus diestrammenae TaxID=1155073 RepID=UPI00195CE6E3